MSYAPHPLALALTLVLTLAACAESPQPRTTDPSDPDTARVAASNNRYTLDVLREVDTDEPNTFLSPFSMNAALSMTLAGARGETAAQMQDVLHIEDAAAHHGPMGALVRDLNGDLGRSYTLRVANRLWVDDGQPVRAEFLDVTETDYGAPTVEADIAEDPEGVRSDVNAWVAEETEGHIAELMPTGSISSATRLVLANAIYFKADWAHRFDPQDTRPEDFLTALGDTVQTDMMRGELPLAYDAADSFTVGGLAYGEDAEMRLWVVLPASGVTIGELVRDLGADDLDAAFDRAVTVDADVSLPKLDTRTTVALRPLLEGLGMPAAFSSDADFTGLQESGDLQLGGVYHQAYVKMDEAGTTAAAATAAVMDLDTAPPPTPFTVDRPYLFVIRDELSGAWLFVGRIGDPSAGGGVE